MSSGYTNAAKNAMLDALGVDLASLHTDDPGSNGANEVAGGTPAYAQKTITWNAAGSGARSSSNAPQFDIPAGTTITHVGYWDGGVFFGSDALDTPHVFASQGVFDLDSVVLTLRNESFYD